MGVEPAIVGTAGLRPCHCAILPVGMSVAAVVGGLVADPETFRDGYRWVCHILRKYPTRTSQKKTEGSRNRNRRLAYSVQYFGAYKKPDCKIYARLFLKVMTVHS